jgi:DNA-binding transcriptional LysR family regulator
MHLKEVDANLLVILDALLVDASVTRAAERLGRSASAISHALAKLREIFADELFVRAGQRLVPTAKALELAPTVHVILAGM